MRKESSEVAAKAVIIVVSISISVLAIAGVTKLIILMFR